MARVIGAVVWLAATIALKLSVIESLFLWAPLVVVPLGLDLIPRSGWLDRAIRLAQPWAALLAAASFVADPGQTAALLAAPWALVCLSMAAWASIRFFRRGRWDFAETFVDAALGLIAVGGWGFVMSRAGMKPAGFGEPIVLLTAVHFHYTAFVAPLLVGMAARRAGPRRPILFSGAAVVIGTPMLAAGFTLYIPAVKIVAVFLIAAGLAVFAWELTRLAVDEPLARTRTLLGIAAFSIFWGMVLAWLYSYGEFRQRVMVEIPAMAWSHGVLNALGFATCGLLGARAWRA
jgi:hypothetical protein